MRRRLATIFAVFAVLLLGSLIHAGRAEAGISTCSVSSSGIVFSPYDTQTKAAVDGTGTISVTCSGTSTSNNLSLNITGGYAGSCTSRQMRNGGSSLVYNIYHESARVTNWCDGSQRYEIAFDFASGSPQTKTYTMYGRVSSAQTPPWGSYSDTLTITLKQGGGNIASTTAPISGSVSPTCSASAGTLGFGTYAPASASVSTAAVSVNCSNGASYQVSLGGGNNASGGTRRMVGPSSSYLSYQLFSDALRTVAWGDGSALGAKVSRTGTGSAQSLTVYGRIPAAQSPRAGSYSDTVVVTVEY